VKHGFTYADCWVEDSRLVVLNAMAAAELGAAIHTRSRCERACRDGDGWLADIVGEDGRQSPVRARALVNAAGPWVSTFLSEGLGVNSAKRVRLIKGSHIVVPRLYSGEHPYILQNNDKRIVFVIPFEGEFSLIGTTDVPHDGDPAGAVITADETEYLCRAVNRYFQRQIGPSDVVWSYAGVRPLYDDASGDASAVTRDYVFDLDAGDGRAPLLSIFGGKITTYRKLAEHALEKLQPVMGFAGGGWTARAALPGGDIPNADFTQFLATARAAHPWLPNVLLHRWARAYGTRLEMIVGGANCAQDLGQDLGGGLYQAEVDYLVAHEWARTAEDILWRRSRLGLHVGEDTVVRLARLLEGAGAQARTAAVG
jgi:glycerol-3-phosphate dehydrogenase